VAVSTVWKERERVKAGFYDREEFWDLLAEKVRREF
jgi:hypothetical protein